MDDVTAATEGQPAEAPEVADVNVGEVSQAPADSEFYTVKVGGEETQVTRDELLAGYSRQADYTRKTQELAEQRKALEEAAAIQEALTKNPEWTINTLAQRYGVHLQQPQQPVPATEIANDPWGADSESQDPRIAALESEIEALRTSVQRDHVEAQIQKLEQQDPSFDRDLLYTTALKHQVDDVNVAYRLMQADILQAQLAQREEAEKQVVAQKEAVAAVHSGPSRSTQASANSGEMPKSVFDAWRMARES